MPLPSVVARMYYLQPRPKTYSQVHHGLQWAYGPAEQHSCISCGGKAKDWAYQYSAGDKQQVSESGAVYSDDLNNYAPMCRSCHRSFDIKNDPKRHVSPNFQRGGQKAINELISSDPTWLGYRGENMRRLNEKKVLCGGCTLRTNPGALALHRLATGHKS